MITSREVLISSTAMYVCNKQSLTCRVVFDFLVPSIERTGSIPLFLRLNAVPSSVAEKLKRVDWVGSFIFVASMTSFLIPLTWGA